MVNCTEVVIIAYVSAQRVFAHVRVSASALDAGRGGVSLRYDAIDKLVIHVVAYLVDACQHDNDVLNDSVTGNDRNRFSDRIGWENNVLVSFLHF